MINGAWYLEIVGDTHFAKRSKGAKSHVHFWRVPRFEEIAVAGRQWRGDYNTIMAQAQKEYDETH
ncbi:hypothetical protein CFB82_19965 [Burkholderia sp. HI2714]|nr:hypothetical protein CFB82_19965 [Burkholderia sp. HI2714]